MIRTIRGKKRGIEIVINIDDDMPLDQQKEMLKTIQNFVDQFDSVNDFMGMVDYAIRNAMNAPNN